MSGRKEKPCCRVTPMHISTIVPVPGNCPKCGLRARTGVVSCCFSGGSWFKKCGEPGNPKFDHTWFDGIQACKSKETDITDRRVYNCRDVLVTLNCFPIVCMSLRCMAIWMRGD